MRQTGLAGYAAEAIALPYDRLIFVQSASIMPQAELAGCQRTARALPYDRLSFMQSASVSRQVELAECAADGKSVAVQAVVFCAVRFDYAAGGTR